MPDSRTGGRAPDVQVFDGRLVITPGARPPAKVWLRRDRQILAKTPPMTGNKQWLRTVVGIRSPRLDDDGRWTVPRSRLTRLVIGAIDRFNYVVVYRDMTRLSRCTTLCLTATGVECDCSCQGLHHGQGDASSWFERIGDVVVADLGGYTRTTVVYGGPRSATTGTVLYAGELDGHRYRADRVGRHDWPAASRYMCAACLTARARVWDHCHTHGYVRAPLCNTCNTRHWTGWDPQYGRPRPSRTFDPTYYRRCPDYGQVPACSA
ncbi:MAG: hypothetical protein QG597_186 [Actinomycetota bacterium]|nr:hypothetical protein [Actinomycetota bacterium]